MEALPRDCWSHMFTFVPWEDTYALLQTCSAARDGSHCGIRAVFQSWSDPYPDERNILVHSAMPKRALYRNVLWDKFIRLLNGEDRLSEAEKERAWALLHVWRKHGIHPTPRDIAWIDHVVNDIIAFRGGEEGSALCLRETMGLPYPPRSFTLGGIEYTLKGGILRGGGFIMGTVLHNAKWHTTKRWTRALGDYLQYLENNPMRILTRGRRCPFCGRAWSDPKSLGPECAMLLTQWNTWIAKVLEAQTVHYHEKRHWEVLLGKPHPSRHGTDQTKTT